MWEPKTELEFSHRSPAGELIGVPASNGLFQIPYAYLRKRCLEDKKIKWDEGGVYVDASSLLYPSDPKAA